MTHAESYQAKLAGLSSAVHGRNPLLVGIALCGFSAGKSASEIANDIYANCGNPPLKESEIRRAVTKAELLHGNESPRTAYAINIAKAQKTASTASESDRAFVSHAVQNGNANAVSTYGDLWRLSPVKGLAHMSQVDQARQFVATVFPDDRHFVFACKETELRRKRTRESLRYPSVLFNSIRSVDDIPSYAIANQFSGEEGDNGSYACTSTLVTRRLTLIEFDSMPLWTQCAFWVRMIEGGHVPGLRTLVFSGSKSIHALIRMKDAVEQTVGTDEDELGEHRTSYDARAAIDAWAKEREVFERGIASSDLVEFKCDKACKDPTRLTRFAGAKRTLKDGTTSVQRLLWCQLPAIEADVPTYGDGIKPLIATNYETI